MKVSKYPKVSCWKEWVRLFSNLRLIFFRSSQTQYSSDITQKFEVLVKNYWWIYIEKSQFQTKNENFETVSQCRKCKRGTFWDFFTSNCFAKCLKKFFEGAFGGIKNFRKKSLSAEKK